jgi:RNA polymerase sigma factor (TIGR02999 family)
MGSGVPPPQESRQPEAAGGRRPAERLLPEVYAELRRLAQERLGHERRDHTLLATDLVHEAFLRLVGDRPGGWESRAQFFSAAAEAMRRILIEHARARGRLRHGGGQQKITLSGIDLAKEQDLAQVLAVDEVYQRLAEADPRTADVVRMRFYAGLSEEETAAALGLSARTVRREWSFARAWLFAALRERG